MTKTVLILDDALLKRLERFVSLGDLSKLVGELLHQRVEQLEQTEVTMGEGYSATRSERQMLNADWQIADGAGWPD